MLLFFGGEVSGRSGFGGDFAFGWAVVGEGVVEIEGERFGRVGEATERGFGLVELFVTEPGGGGADAGLGLEALDFERLAFGGSFGAGGKVFADAFAVELT